MTLSAPSSHPPIAIERPRERATSVRRGIGRGALFLLVLATLWGMWEGYRALWIHEHWTWPFVVDNTTMPHLHDIVHALFRPARFQGPLLISVLLKAAAFTAKEAAIGDRKSTRLNSSHLVISYAVFCLKKKKIINRITHNHGCQTVGNT